MRTKSSSQLPEPGSESPISIKRLQEALGVKGDGPEAVEALSKQLDATLKRDDLVKEVGQKIGVSNVAELRKELTGIRRNLDGGKLFSEKMEKKGILTRIKDGLVSTGSFLNRHKWKIIVLAAAGVLSWHFRGYILAWLQKLFSKLPQAKQEISMAKDEILNRPLPEVNPNPDVPLWNENPLPGPPRSPGSYPNIKPPPLPPSA